MSPALRSCLALGGLFLAGACGSSTREETTPSPSSGSGGAGGTGSATTSGGVGGATASSAGQTAGAGGEAGCATVTAAGEVVLATATVAGEHALALDALSADTSWGEKGNEALVLEILNDAGLVGHLVLHQGATSFTYGMHVGALSAGETLRARVSPLSSTVGPKEACLGPAKLTPASALGAAAEGLAHAPIFRWPTKKRFDDLPLVVGWSKAKQGYQVVYTSENGGTVAICGGGAKGMQAELARWGRGADIEGAFVYGGSSPTWGRCDGAKSFDQVKPRLEADHPTFYYGDGHNRLFESRGGYGKTCGTSDHEKSDGDLPGWNVGNPGNDAANDGPYTITLRPLPVDLDGLGYAKFTGRREALLDRRAPWLYRLTFLELEREGKLDQKQTFPMSSYLFLDVHAADVDGSGDSTCSFNVSSGFRIRLHTKKNETLSGPQMTADFFGADEDVKRLAIPLGKSYAATDFDAVELDAYDGDGIYWTALGDAFIVRPAGKNGAELDVVHPASTTVNAYVDDDSSGCSGGVNKDGPGGLPYPCVGGSKTLPLP